MPRLPPSHLVLLVVGVLVGPQQSARAGALPPGVVVEAVSKGSAGEKAGIRPGDVLLAWERPPNPPANPEPAEGRLDSVFDWMWVAMEQAPRGTLHFSAERGGQAIVFEVPIGEFGIAVRPRFEGTVLERYLAGRAALDSKDFEKSVALLRDVASAVASLGETDLVSWITLGIGDAWNEAQRWTNAEAAYEAADLEFERRRNVVGQAAALEALGKTLERQSRLDDAEQAYDSARAVRERICGQCLIMARSLNDLGRVARNRGDLAKAEIYHRRALAIQERLAPNSLVMAASLNNLGAVADIRGELAPAEASYTRALAIRQTLAPDSLEVAASLNNVGAIAWQRGQLAVAEKYYKEALAISETLAPDGLAVASSLIHLGILARNRGQLALAEGCYKRALAIQERLAPGTLDLSHSLNNLGMVAWYRGELATAEAYHKRALVIREQVAPESLYMAGSLNNLGMVAYNRGELAIAESYFRRALELREKQAPDSLEVAVALVNVGEAARERGDLTTAERYHSRALTLREKLAPDSLAVASSLNYLGNLARRRRELAMAQAYYKRALVVAEKWAPGSLDVARYLNNLGNVAIDTGDVAAAEADITRALEIRQRLAPGSSDEAESQHALGLAYRQTNQIRSAANHFLRAIDALEAQEGKLGGTQEARTGFGTRFVDYYRDYIDLLVDLSEPTGAFHMLERSRARTLLAMMAERDLAFGADVPEDVDTDRKRIAWEYDRAQEELRDLNPAEATQVEELLDRMRKLRDRQAQLVERLRHESPRFASLQYPQPLDHSAVQATLDPGTLLLSYSVHADRSYLFALSADAGLQTYHLAVRETQLRDDVERFRRLIQRAQLGATDLPGLVERGRHLYSILIEPAAKAVATAQRVLVIPDGPLHVLPFAVLVRGIDGEATGGRRDWQYLVEWKPLHVAISATVYAELRRQRQERSAPPSQKTLVAFGDPTYPSVNVNGGDSSDLDRQDATVRSLLTRGYRLARLPATRSEVMTIAGVYGQNAEAFLGDAATEEQAKSVAARARYLHFASHGILDERFPLDSGLALTIPPLVKEGQDNGILQAWEIFERVRVGADLVVLSSCETGLGKEMGGEGLVGLTRAFQYAGARSVLASLWSVADETTATLMSRFYRYLKAGRTKDAALRQAQLDLIRGPIPIEDDQKRGTRVDASHPFYWAAFQLNGDWR